MTETGDVGRGGRDCPQGYLASGDSKSQGLEWTGSDWSFVGFQPRDENERDAAGFPEASPEPWSTAPNGLFSHHTIHTGWRPAGLSKQKHALDRGSLRDSGVNVKTTGAFRELVSVAWGRGEEPERRRKALWVNSMGTTR